jgi:peptidoglycan/xylan/chitin deacetylase (PgdA/CDA1 family)
MATLVMADKTDSLAPGSRYAAITFDDAFTHVVLSILPELVARGIPSTLFVPSGPIGGSATWHQTAHSRDREETIATADQLRALPPELVLIGSHSVSHKNMCLLSQQEADWELRESRATLERILGRPVTTFAFPYARFNTRLVEQCKAVGYLRVFTGQPRREPMTQDNYVVGRVRVDPTDTLAEFRLKVYGAYGWLPAMSGVKQRLLRLVGAASAKGRHHADLTSQENRFS